MEKTSETIKPTTEPGTKPIKVSPSATSVCHHPWSASKTHPATRGGPGDPLVMVFGVTTSAKVPTSSFRTWRPLLRVAVPKGWQRLRRGDQGSVTAPRAPRSRFPKAAAGIVVPLSQDLLWNLLMQTLTRIVNGERHKGGHKCAGKMSFGRGEKRWKNS